MLEAAAATSSAPKTAAIVPITPKRELVVPHDPANEAAVIAAAAVDPSILASLVRRAKVDHFVARENADAWAALVEMHRRKLTYDAGTIAIIAGQTTADYIARLVEDRPAVPVNIAWHVENLFWDAARVNAARGSVASFLEALRDAKAEPDKVRGLARAIAGSFDGYENRKFLHAPATLVREQMGEIEQRVAGRACYPFGIRGLDWYDKAIEGEQRRRLLPGAAPGMVTVVTAVSGGGKSTFTGHLALGLAGWDAEAGAWREAPGRRVGYGAWEMNGGMTLELLACLSLRWSRTDLVEGRGHIATHEGRRIMEARMHEISARIQFVGNPFQRRRGEKSGNDGNLDLIQGYIEDCGCDVFIADLWKRCLRDARPEAEEDALIRQQAIAEETRCHCILLQQQRLKDVEMRPDKRPTREGIKGSGAWTEVPDLIIGLHRPALFKRVDDDRIEAFILKQRHGKWPLGIEFDWNADSGSITGGRSIEYDRPGEANELDTFAGDAFLRGKSNGSGARKPWGRRS